MKPGRTEPEIPADIDEEAALWLARSDRGLRAGERAAYERWLAADERHALALARHGRTFAALRNLARCKQDAGIADILKAISPVPRRVPFWRRGWFVPVCGATAAVVIVCAHALWRRAGNATPDTDAQPAPAIVANAQPSVAPSMQIITNEQQALPDGSLAELKDGSRIEPVFSETVRRVRLLAGEVYFTVAKDPARPFIVEVGGVAVQAVGTVFAVRFDHAAVEVLVTEGQVKVSDSAAVTITSPDEAQPAGPASSASAPDPVMVVAGQRAVVARNAETPRAITVMEAPRKLVEETLSWQGPRIQFNETPLADAIAELNRRGRVNFVLEPRSLGALRIGGTFRPDNTEGFVRLLELTLGIKAVRDGDTITLRR
jgi:transmembrane sensor